MNDNYRIALDKRISSGKVFLNNKETPITGYRETDLKAVVTVDGKEVILGEDDNLLINGHESK